MKRIITKSTLHEFLGKHADSKRYLKTWYDTPKGLKWFSPNDVKHTYISACIFKNSRVVFNIKSKLIPTSCEIWLIEISVYSFYRNALWQYKRWNILKKIPAINLKPIKTDKDYQYALERLEVISDAQPHTKAGDEAEILSLVNREAGKWALPDGSD